MHELQGVSDRCKRVSEFVAEHSEKFVLAPVCNAQGLLRFRQFCSPFFHSPFQFLVGLLQRVLCGVLLGNLRGQLLVGTLHPILGLCQVM